jgi:hypothetical protein
MINRDEKGLFFEYANCIPEPRISRLVAEIVLDKFTTFGKRPIEK